MCFGILLLKTKQQRFPINRDSEKAASVLWTLIGRCGFQGLPHLPGHHPITIKTEGLPTVHAGKAREASDGLTHSFIHSFNKLTVNAFRFEKQVGLNILFMELGQDGRQSPFIQHKFHLSLYAV